MGLPYTVAWMGEFILLVHMYYKHTYMYFRYSRKIIWLDVLTTNNDPSVILHSYLLAVLENSGILCFVCHRIKL